MKYRHQISCYIEVSVLHQSFPWPPSLQCLFRFSSSQHHPEAATSRRERLSPELFVSLWNMMDVNDFHWSPHALFVCGMLGAGDFSSAHLNTCADGRARGRWEAVVPVHRFGIHNQSHDSSLPSSSDRRSGKFLRRQLKVMKTNGQQVFFWPGPLSRSHPSCLIQTFKHFGALVSTSNGQSAATLDHRRQTSTLDVKNASPSWTCNALLIQLPAEVVGGKKYSVTAYRFACFGKRRDPSNFDLLTLFAIISLTLWDENRHQQTTPNNYRKKK